VWPHRWGAESPRLGVSFGIVTGYLCISNLVYPPSVITDLM